MTLAEQISTVRTGSSSAKRLVGLAKKIYHPTSRGGEITSFE